MSNFGRKGEIQATITGENSWLVWHAQLSSLYVRISNNFGSILTLVFILQREEVNFLVVPQRSWPTFPSICFTWGRVHLINAIHFISQLNNDHIFFGLQLLATEQNLLKFLKIIRIIGQSGNRQVNMLFLFLPYLFLKIWSLRKQINL